jgi:hypothetical protein
LSRFFAYGCSFTKYYYPTWADIIINDHDEGYNCGRLGSGNQLIANRICETNAVKKFNSDDTIIIMWSNFFRDDVYKDKDGWQTKGNIFFYKDNVEDLSHYVYRDCNLITSTLYSLRTTGATVVSTSINNPYNDDLMLQDKNICNILDRYEPWVRPQTKTLHEHCWYPNIHKDKTRPQVCIDTLWQIEDHPLPLEHCDFVENVLQYNISEKTARLASEWHARLRSKELHRYDRIFEAGKTIDWVI